MTSEPSGSSRSLPLLVRHRGFAIVTGGQAVSQMGNVMNGMAVAWLVLNLTHSRVDLGFTSAIGSFVSMGLLVSGVYVDRWNRRRAMIGADSVRAVVMLALVLLAALHQLTLGVVIGAVVVAGLAGTVFSPASMAFLPELVERDDLPSANGTWSAASTAAQLLGNPVGGWVLDIFGPLGVFLFNGVTFVVSVLTLSSVRPVRVPSREQPATSGVKTFMAQFREGWHLIWHQPLLRRVVVAGMVSSLGSGSIMAFEVVWIREILHRGAFYYGLFSLAFAGGGLVAGLLFGKVSKRVDPVRLIMGTLMGSGALLVVFSAIPEVWLDLVIYFLLGVLVGGLGISLSVFLQTTVPLEILGRSVSTMGAITNALTPVSAIATGFLASRLPLSEVFSADGVLIMVSATIFLRSRNSENAQRFT